MLLKKKTNLLHWSKFIYPNTYYFLRHIVKTIPNCNIYTEKWLGSSEKKLRFGVAEKYFYRKIVWSRKACATSVYLLWLKKNLDA